MRKEIEGESAQGKREEGKRGNEIEGGEKREEGWKVVFWNVAGLGNKDGDFWKGLREWDVLVLSETWVNEKGWVRVRRKLPGGHGQCNGQRGRVEREGQ